MLFNAVPVRQQSMYAKGQGKTGKCIEFHHMILKSISMP